MKQETLIAAAIAAALAGGGVYFWMRRAQMKEPQVAPVPQPTPVPTPVPATSEARRAIEQAIQQLAANPAQREVIANTLEAQATLLSVSGGRPEDIMLLRNAAGAIRRGEVPALPPSTGAYAPYAFPYAASAQRYVWT